MIQPPNPTGLFTFSQLFTDQPGVKATGDPLASFLLGQVQQFSIDFKKKHPSLVLTLRNISCKTTGR